MRERKKKKEEEPKNNNDNNRDEGKKRVYIFHLNQSDQKINDFQCM